jgi:hypothetical protein
VPLGLLYWWLRRSRADAGAGAARGLSARG